MRTHARSLVLGLVALAVPGLAQAGWKTFTAREGLGSNHVYFVSEDRAGNLWFGTSNGVTRYDGNWRTFTDADGAGRLVQEVVAGQAFGAGANLVRWNGRDREGHLVPDGPYVVTVEALGETRRGPLAVVR